MRVVLNAGQMRKCDNYTSEHFGIDSAVLMERAALATFISVCNLGEMFEDTRTLVVCGTGNNGADGLALARILFEGGYSGDFCIPFDDGRHSALFDRQLDTLEKYGLTPVEFGGLRDEYDIIVDAVFGTGLSRALSPERAALIEKLNSFGGLHVAMDIPSGINADTGEVMGAAFEADLTVTYGFAKRGLVLDPGRIYAGKLLIANIGITDKSLECLGDEKQPGDMPDPVLTGLPRVMETEDLLRNLPVRPADGNKGTFGKVLIFAGSEEISGACVLSSLAAFKTGSGMVKVITNRANADIIKKTLPEAMVTSVDPRGSDTDRAYPEGECGKNTGKSIYERLDADLGWADVILAGPGIGTDAGAKELLTYILDNSGDKPMVIDADGLNIISTDSLLKEKTARRKGFTALTPHIEELSRLTGKTAGELKSGIIEEAADYAALNNVCLVAKDSVTTVTDGKKTVLVTCGNSGMATAGSGDVLAGVIAAMLGNVVGIEKSGRTFNPVGAESNPEYTDKLLRAVESAVYLHGIAGSACLESMAEDSVTAGDIIVSLQRVLKQIRDSR